MAHSTKHQLLSVFLVSISCATTVCAAPKPRATLPSASASCVDMNGNKQCGDPGDQPLMSVMERMDGYVYIDASLAEPASDGRARPRTRTGTPNIVISEPLSSIRKSDEVEIAAPGDVILNVAPAKTMRTLTIASESGRVTIGPDVMFKTNEGLSIDAEKGITVMDGAQLANRMGSVYLSSYDGDVTVESNAVLTCSEDVNLSASGARAKVVMGAGARLAGAGEYGVNLYSEKRIQLDGAYLKGPSIAVYAESNLKMSKTSIEASNLRDSDEYLSIDAPNATKKLVLGGGNKIKITTFTDASVNGEPLND